MPAASTASALREPGVDVELGIGEDAVLLLRRRRVVALVGDDARHVAALADAEEHRLRRQRLLRHAAEPLDADQPVRLDLPHDQPELVHVREQHDARRALRRPQRRDQVAEPVGARRDAERGERRGDSAGARGPRSR